MNYCFQSYFLILSLLNSNPNSATNCNNLVTTQQPPPNDQQHLTNNHRNNLNVGAIFIVALLQRPRTQQQRQAQPDLIQPRQAPSKLRFPSSPTWACLDPHKLHQVLNASSSPQPYTSKPQPCYPNAERGRECRGERDLRVLGTTKNVRGEKERGIKKEV